MRKVNTVMLARVVAERAHAGQTRRDGHTPYIDHPAAVANKLWLSGEPDEVIATAWLHDVLEDTGETVWSLRDSGIPEDIIEAVVVLTKGSESYEEYLARVGANPIARKVKAADMLHNLSDSPTPKQICKYAEGLLRLVAE